MSKNANAIFDPQSLITGAEIEDGLDYDNSVRVFHTPVDPDSADTVGEILRCSKRVLTDTKLSVNCN